MRSPTPFFAFAFVRVLHKLFTRGCVAMVEIYEEKRQTITNIADTLRLYFSAKYTEQRGGSLSNGCRLKSQQTKKKVFM
jgi:hypothetical protein